MTVFNIDFPIFSQTLFAIYVITVLVGLTMKSRIPSISGSISSPFGRKKTKKSHENSIDDKTFPMFGMLNDDIVPVILSYLVEAPYENGDTIDGRCNMTHVLPLVNKNFYRCTNLLWKQVLNRSLRKEPFLWDPPIYHLIQKAKYLLNNDLPDQDTNEGHLQNVSSTKTCPSTTPNEKSEQIQKNEHNQKTIDKIDEAHKSLIQINHRQQSRNQPSSSQPQTSSSLSPPAQSQSSWMTYRDLYQHVVQNYIRYTSPLFHMPSTLRIGNEIGLHFFEPRYRLLIAEVMAPFPISFQRGEPIVPTVPSSHNQRTPNINNYQFQTNQADRYNYKVFPTFLFANHVPLNKGAPACIVQVKRCMIYADGTADVNLMPIAYVLVHSLNRRRGSGNLWEATTVRMGSQATRRYEHQQQLRLI